MAIRTLCITDDADRPTVASFIGMHQTGIDVTVICPADHPNNKTLMDAGIKTLDIPLDKHFDNRGKSVRELSATIL